MAAATYEKRRGELARYFDETAAEAWTKLTSDAPVSGVRATVRAGREAMAETLLSFLPDDLTGARVLDAGCGAGALAVAMAGRGAAVTAIDLSKTMTDLARERAPKDLSGSVDFRVGDMADEALGRFDHVVAMDSLIHYARPDLVGAVARIARRTEKSVIFTVAPATPLLRVMHAVGKAFPRGDKSPAIRPHDVCALEADLFAQFEFQGWRSGRSKRIKSGFYVSHALELRR